MPYKSSILFFHLFNDFSGSPKVLSQVIKQAKKNHHTTLCTSNTTGILKNSAHEFVDNHYQYKGSKWQKLVALFWSQWIAFLFVLKRRKEQPIIYVNTLLPFGAALAGKLLGLSVIYHIHETSIRPLIFKNFLKWVVKITAKEVVYVSHFLAETEPILPQKNQVIYNALEQSFIEEAQTTPINKSKQFTVLMVCSLKKYKGVDTFVALAKRLTNFRFNLVLNASQAEINTFFAGESLPQNLHIFPKQSQLAPFYAAAHLLLNLSKTDAWLETFGLTLIEGMLFGLPVIGPNQGGPVEVILDKKAGYCLDTKDLDTLTLHLQKLKSDVDLYQNMSQEAQARSQHFYPQRFLIEIDHLLENVLEEKVKALAKAV